MNNKILKCFAVLFFPLFLAAGPVSAQSTASFSDNFESGNLDQYTKTGNVAITTTNPIQGTHSATGTGGAYVTGTALGSNWKTARHGEVDADIRLSSSSDRAGIGFATTASTWIYAELTTGQLVVRMRNGDGSTSNIDSKNYTLNAGTTYKLTMRWSKKSRSILAIVHDASNKFLASLTDICGTHDPSNPMFTLTGAALLDNFRFTQIDTFYLNWQVADWNDSSDLVIIPHQPGFPFGKYLNPGVVLENGTWRMIWRGGDDDWGINLGYAQSTDGIHWTNSGQKIASYEDPEDPMVWPFGHDAGHYHYYTEAGTGGSGLESHIFGSNDCQTWTNLGAIKGISRKLQYIIDCDSAHIPRVNYNGTSYKFWAYYEAGNAAPSNGLGFSNDLLNWTDYGIPTATNSLDTSWSECWSYQYVNAIAAGFVQKDGNVRLFYCATEDGGYSSGGCGSIGELIVNGSKPWEVISKGYLPWGPPVNQGDIARGGTPYGYKDSPIFPTSAIYVSNPTKGDSVYLFYGNNDTSIGLAKAAIADADATDTRPDARHDVPVSSPALSVEGKRISYTIPGGAAGSCDVSIDLFSPSGRKIASLVNGRQAPGAYRISLDRVSCANGIYICRMHAGNFQSAATVVVGNSKCQQSNEFH
jgi:predicted GH43/DUF377 family glycosyl hydrolase